MFSSRQLLTLRVPTPVFLYPEATFDRYRSIARIAWVRLFTWSL